MFWFVACAVAERMATSPSLFSVLADHLHALGADERVVGGVEVHDPAFRSDAGVERNHFDAATHRLLADRHQRVGVVGRNGDGVDFLRDEGVDDGDLFLGRRLGRAGVDQVDVAEFLGRLDAAVVTGVEEAVAERLDDHGDAEPVGGKRRTDADACAGDDRNAAHELQNGPSIEHAFLLFPFFHPANAACSCFRRGRPIRRLRALSARPPARRRPTGSGRRIP